MFLEIKQDRKKKKYYLVHSFRHGRKIKKMRKYLGIDLNKEELQNIMKIAEQQLMQRVKVFRSIADPLLEILSGNEIKKIKELETSKGFKVFHLSEEEWYLFSEIFTYNTNAIEGSELNQKEVNRIIEKNQWPANKTKEDIAEAYGVMRAIQFIRQTKEHISIDLIKRIHEIVFENSKPFAGQLRPKGKEVVVTNGYGQVIHQGAPSEKIIELLDELISWYHTYKKKYPAILLAAVVHNQFENIHPFEDGNGRVGRILMNNILIKHKLPPVNIDFRKRGKYYSSLREYEYDHNVRPTIELLLEEYKELKKQLGRLQNRKHVPAHQAFSL